MRQSNPSRKSILVGGTQNDFIQLEIDDFSLSSTNEPAFSTPDFDQPGALTNTATSVIIPAHTLEPDRQYNAWITFFRGSVDASHPDSWTISGRITETGFTLATLPFTDPTPATSGNRFYRVQTPSTASRRLPRPHHQFLHNHVPPHPHTQHHTLRHVLRT